MGAAGHRSGNLEFHQESLGPGRQGQYIPRAPSSALFIEQTLIPHQCAWQLTRHREL